MTDQHEPEPGSAEWFLAQLSGGRIDSRRERREAEAALEAAGVPIPVVPTDSKPTPAVPADDAEGAGQSPAAEPAAPAEPAEDKPKARFSWETGTLEAVAPSEAADAEAVPAPVPAASPWQSQPVVPVVPEEPAATTRIPVHDATPAEPAAETVAMQSPLFQPAPEPVQPQPVQPATPRPASAFDAALVAEGAAAGAFRWNLSPTDQPDPAVNAATGPIVPDSAAPAFPAPAAAPLVVPRPRPAVSAAATEPEPQTSEPQSSEPQTPEPQSAEPQSSEPRPADPAPTEAMDVLPGEPTALLTPPPAAQRAPLPPGTTAHEFDPFAQDLFAPPAAAASPVPSVDEFTIPDEGAPVQESAVPTGPAADVSAAAEDAPDHVSSDWSDISDMLGAHPQTVDTGIVSPMPPINEILPSFDAALGRPAASERPAPAERPAAVRAAAPIEHSRRGNPTTRWLLIIAAILLAVLIGIALFSVGRALAAGRDAVPVAARTHTAAPSAAPSSTPSATPTATTAASVPPTGTLPSGQTYQWDELRGGECIAPFSGAWAQQFAVVDCDTPHAAQLVYTAPFSSNPAAPFPGESAIVSQLNLLCSAPGVIDMTAAAAYNDLQLSVSYPVTQAQWAAGQRNYYCFVSRSSGQQLTSSIAGSGPAQ